MFLHANIYIFKYRIFSSNYYLKPFKNCTPLDIINSFYYFPTDDNHSHVLTFGLKR